MSSTFFSVLLLIVQLFGLFSLLMSFFVPLDWHQEQGWYRDQFMITLLAFSLVNFIYSLYHFTVKSEVEKYKGVWFIFLLLFNIAAAYVYFIFVIYKRRK